MSLKLMYITNRPEIALIAEEAGVDRIFVDMEYIGKAERQGGMNTVQNHHTIEDICNIRKVIKKAQIMVRVNPIHDGTDNYEESEKEISDAINAGADILMLPYFKTVEEVSRFMRAVNRKAKTILLFETPEAVDKVDKILELEGIDEAYIGLNDLSLSYGKKFMFELLADGTVDKLCYKFCEKGIPYGFGGIASIGKGLLPSEYIIKEHYRLRSTCAILSRSFCNTQEIRNIEDVQSIFTAGIRKIRNLEIECKIHQEYFIKNHKNMVQRILAICEELN